MILLRSAIFNVWFFGTTALLGLVGMGVRTFAPSRALGLARIWALTVLAGARLICGVKVSVTGAERLPAGPVLLASQHQSAFDTLVWATILPRATYVYKVELARIPLFGPMLVASGQIPLDRKTSVAGIRQLLRAVAAAKDDGRQIIIFPEGTRVEVGVDAPIRGGFSLIASRTGLPIYPVATDSGRLWGRRAFRKRPGTIHIDIGPPIDPALPASVLASALKAHWRDTSVAHDRVDNPVDAAANVLTSAKVKYPVEVEK